MPMYGQSFTLSDTKSTGLNQPTAGGGEAGRYTKARGFLAYYEVLFDILTSLQLFEASPNQNYSMNLLLQTILMCFSLARL